MIGGKNGSELRKTGGAGAKGEERTGGRGAGEDEEEEEMGHLRAFISINF
jgi:hypothetical protein